MLENVDTWETASVLYKPFDFIQVPGEERKFIHLLAKDLAEVDWSTSVKNWMTKLQRIYNENFIVSRCGQIAVMFSTCSKSKQDWILASGFCTESADESYNFITLIKTLGGIYSSVNHAVVAQQGPAVGWSAHHHANLIESVVKGVSNRRLADLIATYQIPVPFSFIKF